MPLTPILASTWLNYEFGLSAYTPPVTHYLGLLTAAPDPANLTAPYGAVENTGSNYARVAMANTTANWIKINSTTIGLRPPATWPTLTGTAGGASVAVGLWDVANSGTIKAYAMLPARYAWISGDRPYFPGFTAKDGYSLQFQMLGIIEL